MTPASPSLPAIGAGPTPPPVFASDPQGQKPKAKSQNTTFLGSGSTPSASPWGGGIQGKSLLGQ